MKASVLLGLESLFNQSPAPPGFLLAPGDAVGLTHEAVRRVLAAFHAQPNQIHVASLEGQRAHPAAFPHDALHAIRDLPTNLGINAIVDAGPWPVALVECPIPTLNADLDTPDDYDRWIHCTKSPGPT
jgi:CTP:molybdopterin cytidylyltransferase MocA